MESFIGTNSGSSVSGLGSGFISRGPQRILPRLTQPAQIGDYLECDVVLAYTPQFDADVTEFPVEDGFSIADHCIRKPMKLTMEVLFTPTPVTWYSAIMGGGRHTLNRCLNAIMDIWKKGEPVTIKTASAIYTDMVLTSAPMPRRADDGYCYKCTLQFVHVRRVTQRTEDIPEDGCNADAQGKAGETNKDGGAASTQEIGTGLQTVDAPSVAQSSGDIWTDIATGAIDLSQFGDIGTGLEASAAMAQTAIARSMSGGGVLW
jgi:hypothetical protein